VSCRPTESQHTTIDGPAKNVVAVAHHCVARSDFKFATQLESPDS
jgi:hypothetical protein